jgi:hypothetical protein
MAYPGLDASKGRPHLGGALGAELARALIERGWVEPRPGSRAARITPAGKCARAPHLRGSGVDVEALLGDAAAR